MELVDCTGSVDMDKVAALSSPAFVSAMEALGMGMAVAARKNHLATVIVLVLLQHLHAPERVIWSLCAKRAMSWLSRELGLPVAQDLVVRGLATCATCA